MKYTKEIVINKPIDRVVELFDDPDSMHKWMKGLQSFEHLSGEPGQVGARSRLVFKMGKRDVEMIETILVRNLPQEFSGTYEAKGVFNVVKNKFYPINANSTRYVTEQEFRFTGFMKVIGLLMRGAFYKQTMKMLGAFKSFVESK